MSANVSPKPKVAILYSLARTGGTLVSRCLGCIPGNVVLSEVHPRGAFFHPLDQAKDWYGLVTDEEWHELRHLNPVAYVDAIKLISTRCEEKGQNLIIRDWTHIDFTPVGGNKYPVPPSYRLWQFEALREHFDIRHIALIRDPVDSYLSVSRLLDLRGLVNLEEYLSGFHRFAQVASRIGYVRFEDFCGAPESTLKNICKVLGVAFDSRFQEWLSNYKTVTGDVYDEARTHTHTGDSVDERSPNSIAMVPRRPEYPALVEQLKSNDDYNAIIKLLGYVS